MKAFYQTGLLSLLVITASAANAVPMISDNYIGADDNGWGDVVGSTSNFQIHGMDVSLSGSMLSISISTTFAGKGDNRLFAGYTTDGMGIGYGDLFLAGSWQPYGSAPYAGDDASNGTVWEYGFALEDRYMSESATGSGSLYRLNSGDNSDIRLSDSFITGGAVFRNGQEVAVDTANGDISKISDGQWSTDADSVDFLIDLSGTGLLNGDEIAMRWEFTCANDVIEAAFDVPEPGMFALLSTSLVGLGLFGRRGRRQSA